MTFPTHIVAVGGIVEDGRGHILLVRTRNRGWEFPGGQVEVGENLMEALAREVREESGVRVRPRFLVGVYSNTAPSTWHDNRTVVPTKVMLDFGCSYSGGDLTPSEETPDVRWIDKGHVLQLMTAPAIQTRFQAYCDYDGDRP